INCRHKCDCNSFTDLIDVLQSLHDLDETQDSANNPDGRCVSGCGFEDLGDTFVFLSAVVEMQLHHLSQVRCAHAIDCQHEALFQKRILDFCQFRVQRKDALFSGLKRIAKQIPNDRLGFWFGIEEDVLEVHEGLEDNAQWKLNHDSAYRAANNDQGGGGLNQLGNLSSIEDQAKNDSQASEDYAAEGAFVQTKSHKDPRETVSAFRSATTGSLRGRSFGAQQSHRSAGPIPCLVNRRRVRMVFYRQVSWNIPYTLALGPA